MLADRVKVATATTGAGTLSLGAAEAGYRDFSVLPTGAHVSYAIEEGTAWEVGTGTYTAGTDGPPATAATLTRTVTASSANGSPITLAGGGKVFVTALAADIVPVERVDAMERENLYQALNIAGLQGTARGYGMTWADDFADQSGVDAVASTNEAFDGVLRAYKNSNTVLLLNMNGADGSTVFPDATGKTIIPVGGVKVSTVLSKFGGASAFFPGPGINAGYLRSGLEPDFSLFGGDFTVHFWVNFASIADFPHLFQIGSDVNNRTVIYMDSARLSVFTVRTGAQAIVPVRSAALSVGVWYHVALVKQGSVFTLYLDGVSIGSFTTDIHPLAGTPLLVNVGFQQFNGNVNFDYLNGYVDDFQIKRGEALYTANFTPPATQATDAASAVTLQSVGLPIAATPTRAREIVHARAPGGQPITAADLSVALSRNGTTFVPANVTFRQTLTNGFSEFEVDDLNLTGHAAASPPKIWWRVLMGGAFAMQVGGVVVQGKA